MTPTDASVQTGTWSTFHLAGEVFALPVEEVQEVLMDQELAPVPLAPDHILGLLNLRGQIVPAIDLRLRLHLPPLPEGQRGKLLVLSTGGGPITVRVDDIGDVLPLPPEGWAPVPDTLPPEQAAFVTGIHPVEGGVVLGLRTDRLADEGEGQSRRAP